MGLTPSENARASLAGCIRDAGVPRRHQAAEIDIASKRRPSPGSRCYWKATHGEDCAIVLYMFQRVHDGHPSWAVSWRGAVIAAHRGEGEPICQPTSSPTPAPTANKAKAVSPS